jgi:hypothetical protein
MQDEKDTINQDVYDELNVAYKKLYVDLLNLEKESEKLREDIVNITDKAKMKNILVDIINQPD